MSTARPLLTLVVVLHDDETRLPAFADVVRAQTLPADRIQVVLVDAGSSDGTATAAGAWAAEDDRVQVLSAPSASLGSARNTGLAAATGEWVSFPRVSDHFSRDFLTKVAGFAAENPDVVMVATNKVVREHDGSIRDMLPLRMFHRGDRALDLARLPEIIAGDVTSTFFRTDLVHGSDVTFADLWSGASEPFDFAWRLLLRCGSQQVGLMRTAKYQQFRGVELSGRIEGVRPPASDEHPTVRLLRDSFLGVLDEAAGHGPLPEWLEHQVAFGLSRLLATTDARPPLGLPQDPDDQERFHELVAEILGRLDVDDVVPHLMGRIRRRTRYVMQHGYREEPWCEPFVLLSDLDEEQQLVKATYHFIGEDPVEEFRSNGERVEPIHAKTQHLYYTGRLLLKCRVAWIPFRGMLEARLDDEARELAFEPPPFPRKRVTQGFAGHLLRQEQAPASEVPTSRRGRLAQRLAGSGRAQKKYADAWVLMDRLHDAGDNGEALFRHLRESEPGINAWFALEKDSPHWDRLARAGYKDRMVAHGSIEWRVVMSHARHLLSSHADLAVTSPEDVREIARPQWRFTFLQHGVIMFDLSHWLNAKELDVMVTSTHGEFHSIAGDTSQYDVTTRETALTGMPRWDRLLELSRAQETRDLLLVTPTWRKWLLPPLVPGTQKRVLDLSALESTFFRQWKAFLSDERLEKVARDHGLEVGFLPHPNLQPLLGHLDLPAHVHPLTYAEHDVQELIARARLMVTDYSSIAFDAAYTDRPVVYFQFDTEEMLGGSHVGSRGYFDFEVDGFGPVAHTLDDAVQAVQAVVEAGPAPLPAYADRAAATFPDRDGGCCARVVRAVRRARQSQADGPVVPTPAASRPWR